MDNEDKVMQLLDDLKKKYGEFLDSTASEAGDGSGLHFDLTSGNIINGNEIYIESFYLKPEAQGQGIGRKMVNALKKLSDEINVPITLLDKTLESAYSSSFWRNMGFDLDDDTASAFYNYEGDPQSSRFARESLQSITAPLAPDNLADDLKNINKSVEEFFKSYNDSNRKHSHSDLADYLLQKHNYSIVESYIESFVEEQGNINPGFNEISYNEFKKFKNNINLDINVSNDSYLKNYFDQPTNVVEDSNLADDVAEVNNDFVYEKFAERQKTTDSVIMRQGEDGLEVIVIERKRGPHRNLAALPGGILETPIDETKLIEQLINPDADRLTTEIRTNDLWVQPKSITFKGDRESQLNQINLTLDAIREGTLTNKFPNEIYAYEALREAIEEVSLDLKYVDGIFPLKIKKNRFDWDARAAQGVDVGGAFIWLQDEVDPIVVDGRREYKVLSTWEPQAGDDALNYKWVSVEDIANGKVEMAFGHAEWLKESLEVLNLEVGIQKDIDEVQTYIDNLQTISEANSERNKNIIVESNKVRVQNGQPEILTNGTAITDGEKQAFLAAYRNTPMGLINSNFAHHEKLHPDLIFNNLFSPFMYQDMQTYEGDIMDFYDLNLETDFKSSYTAGIRSEFELEADFSIDDAYRVEGVQLSDQGKINVKNSIKKHIGDNYRYTLMTIGSELRFGPEENKAGYAILESMYNNFDSILNSSEYDQLLDKIISGDIDIVGFGDVDDFDSVLDFPQSEIAEGPKNILERIRVADWNAGILDEYGYLDEIRRNRYNFQIEREGIEATWDAIINTISAEDPEIGALYNKIRETNTKHFYNTFPDEVLIPGIEFLDEMNQEGFLDTMKAQVIDGRLTGISYHGNPGLNKPGRDILQIIRDVVPESNTPMDSSVWADSPIAMGEGANESVDTLLERHLNKIATENNLDWLDPSKYRGKNLRGSVFYSTTQPFLASDYGQGGFSTVVWDKYRSSIQNYVELLVNSDLVTDDQRIIINNKINELGLELHKEVIYPSSEEGYRLRTLDGSPIVFGQPIVMQNNYSIPEDRIMNVDMSLYPQTNNSNLRESLRFVRENALPSNVFNDQYINKAIERINLFPFSTNEFAEPVANFFAKAMDNPDSKEFKFIKQVMLDTFEYHHVGGEQKLKSDLVDEVIRSALQPGSDTKWSDINRVVTNNYATYDTPSYLNTPIILEDGSEYFDPETSYEKSKITEGIDDDVVQFFQDVYKMENARDKHIYRLLYGGVGGLDHSVTFDEVGEARSDNILLKSLSQGGIEAQVGTGGGRTAGTSFHDTVLVVDPGNVFESSTPKESIFQTKAIEITEDQARLMIEIADGSKKMTDLSYGEIALLSEFINLNELINQPEASKEYIDTVSEIYKKLGINDERFITGSAADNILPIDAKFFPLFDEYRKMLDAKSIGVDIPPSVIQAHTDQIFGLLKNSVGPEDLPKAVVQTGLLQSVATGLDMFDAAVFAPVILDMLFSRTTGLGAETETIGGSIAEVATNIYDPTKEDTVFEGMYGSPEDPTTLAGSFSDLFGTVKENYIEPVGNHLKQNQLFMLAFDRIKEGAIEGLNTVKDDLGLNDWLYKVKRDMFVTSSLTEQGYNKDSKYVPQGLVKKLENEYEKYIPKEEDRWGRPLNVGNNNDDSVMATSSNNRGGGGRQKRV